MRITNSMLRERALRDLQSNYAALAKSQEQVSSGKRLNRPSDSPPDVQKSVSLNDSVASMEQYLRNIQAAQRITSTEETALASAGNAMQRLKELALQAANGTLSPQDRTAALAEVRQLADEVVGLANTKLGADYLFSGQRTSTPAYANAAAPYGGDGGAMQARISPGVAIRMNVTANAAFGPSLAAASQLAADLAAGSPPSAATIASLDTGLDAVLSARTTIGAVEKRLEDALNFLTDTEQATTAILSKLQDADTATVISDAASRQVTYQAAIAVNAKLLQRSLIDEL